MYSPVCKENMLSQKTLCHINVLLHVQYSHKVTQHKLFFHGNYFFLGVLSNIQRYGAFTGQYFLLGFSLSNMSEFLQISPVNGTSVAYEILLWHGRSTTSSLYHLVTTHQTHWCCNKIRILVLLKITVSYLFPTSPAMQDD